MCPRTVFQSLSRKAGFYSCAFNSRPETIYLIRKPELRVSRPAAKLETLIAKAGKPEARKTCFLSSSSFEHNCPAIFLLPSPPCAYIFPLQENTYKKQTFLGRGPPFQLSIFPIFLGLTFHVSNFPIFLGLNFHFSKFSGPNFPTLKHSKVRPRKIGKLES